jgi:prevent-host-death family protein
MTKLAASKARDAFSDTLNRVAYRGERIVLRRRGKDLAAIVPIEDLKLIQRTEDEIDQREAKKALSDMKRRGLKPIPYEQVRKRLGLK